MNPATAEETAVETGGISPRAASGLVINLIPKEGGNTFRGEAAGTYSDEHLQSDNLTDELRARGVTTTTKVLHLYDTNVAGGRSDQAGPAVVLRGAGRWAPGASNPGVFFNKTQGTPFYTPDLTRPAYRQEWLKSAGGRLDLAGVGEKQGERLCRSRRTSSIGDGAICRAGGVQAQFELLAAGAVSGVPGARR